MGNFISLKQHSNIFKCDDEAKIISKHRGRAYSSSSNRQTSLERNGSISAFSDDKKDEEEEEAEGVQLTEAYMQGINWGRFFEQASTRPPLLGLHPIWTNTVWRYCEAQLARNAALKKVRQEKLNKLKEYKRSQSA